MSSDSAPSKADDIISAIYFYGGRKPHAQALFDGTSALTYGDLRERMCRVGNAVHGGLGLGPGDNAGVVVPNCLEFVELLLGLAAAGVTAVLINARLSAPEIRQVCGDANLSVLFVHERLLGLLEDARLPPQPRTVTVGSEDYERWLAAAATTKPVVAVDPDRPMIMPFTGGTTGRPKGVLLSRRSRSALYDRMRTYFPCYTSADRNLTVAPMYHGAGFNFFLSTLYAGGSVSIMTGFDPARFLDRIQRDGITNASVVPTHLSAILNMGRKEIKCRDTSSLKALFSNGAPLGYENKKQLIDVFGPSLLFDVYGGTEAGIVSVLSPADQLRVPDSVGLPFPQTELKILDTQGIAVPAGSSGEVFTRSPFMFSGYWGRPERPSEEWFSAGDIGRVDSDGYLYLIDRKDEMIITGGLNVFPREVEVALETHSQVRDVVVFGVPDPYWGEAVNAVVVLRDGASCTEAELTAYAGETLARYKLPKVVYFVSELPRSDVGKVMRKALRETYTYRGAPRS